MVFYYVGVYGVLDSGLGLACVSGTMSERGEGG